MAEQHRATAEQRALIEHFVSSTNIEVYGGVEALEAAQQSHLIDPEREKMARKVMEDAGLAPPWPRWSEFERCAASIEASKDDKPADSQPQPNHSEIPDSSLVERVAAAISGDTDGLIDLKPEARAAIREVAAWLSEQERYVLDWVAVTLEEEAKHRST